MYEFFCRTHYIDSCLNVSELNFLCEELDYDSDYGDFDSISPPSAKLDLRAFITYGNVKFYRDTYIEMLSNKKAYRKFPLPDTPLGRIWPSIEKQSKILLHIIYLYLLIGKHNYTSIFIYLQNLFTHQDAVYMICSLFLYITDSTQMRYESREFLKFLYLTFIDAGTNMQCTFTNGNISLNLTKIDGVIIDLQAMFVTSPIWFFWVIFSIWTKKLILQNDLKVSCKYFKK